MPLQPSLEYEGTLNLPDGCRVVSVRVDNVQRCFALGANGHPLARNGYPSIDRAKEIIADHQHTGKTLDIETQAPSALPPEERVALEPLIDTVMYLEISGVYVALLGVLLGGEAVLWIVALPTKKGVRSFKVFENEERAVAEYERLSAQLTSRTQDVKKT
ncbi:MAG: hypothetical protein MJA83_06005 [Gammaproteobacteria bacterium]|nr:hypothetical protein [Gammaproteobacteria bacterium]